MTEIMPVPRILILLSYQQGALAVLLFVFQYPPSFLSCNALDVFHVNYFFIHS